MKLSHGDFYLALEDGFWNMVTVKQREPWGHLGKNRPGRSGYGCKFPSSGSLPAPTALGIARKVMDGAGESRWRAREGAEAGQIGPPGNSKDELDLKCHGSTEVMVLSRRMTGWIFVLTGSSGIWVLGRLQRGRDGSRGWVGCFSFYLDRKLQGLGPGWLIVDMVKRLELRSCF